MKQPAGRIRISAPRTVVIRRRRLDALNTAYSIREAQKPHRRAGAPIWLLGRIGAGIPDAPQRCPKGLRHGFGINATVKGIPLHMLQKWMGHAQLSTTTIHAEAVGQKKQDIAARM